MAIGFWQAGLCAALAGLLAGSAGAQSDPAAARRAWGTPAALSQAAPQSRASQSLGRIAPSRGLVYRNASVATGGIGLRNQGAGGIEVSGVVGPVKAGFAYWAVISQGAPVGASASLLIRRPGGGGNFTRIAGTAVGTGPTPCWGGDRITVFRGSLPRSIATGNGHYRIELLAGASGTRNGADPWENAPLPLIDGASVVIVGSGAATVAIYDRGLAGRTFFPQLAYRLELPVSARNATRLLFHNIGADGQIGRSIDAFPKTAAEITAIGDAGVRIAGPGSDVGDSGWNGGVAAPLPQLWDNTASDITAQARRANIGDVMPVTVSAPDDCLTPVANIVSVSNQPVSP